MVRKLGWKPDKPDMRDFYLSQKFPALSKAVKITKNIDLRSKCPPIYDQGDLGSCVGQAWAFAVQFEEMNVTKKPTSTPSRLFIYYNARSYIGTTDYDSGAEIRDGIKSINKLGTCYENLWGYNISRFAKRPYRKCYNEAEKNKALVYYRLNQDRSELLNCLISGFPFVFGISVYESFYSEQAETQGIIPMPKNDEALLGGHAVVAVGYGLTSDRIIFRNSWGTSWGIKGYGVIPMNYLLNNDLADDFWTLRKTS